MRTQIIYEWGIETLDEHGDIIDTNYESKLTDLRPLQENERLVLIRDEGNEHEGLMDRFWSYPVNGELPEYFQGANGNVNIKVPVKFHTEYKQYTKLSS